MGGIGVIVLTTPIISDPNDNIRSNRLSRMALKVPRENEDISHAQWLESVLYAGV